MPENIQGLISRINFRNPETGWHVLSITPNQRGKDDDIMIKAVGTIPGNSVREGDEYRFSGEWSTHEKFGKQFKFTDFEVILPNNRSGIIAYFQSDHFYGIGPVAAGKIVDALGEDALEKLKQNPDLASTIPGITPKQAREITRKMREHSSLGDLISTICTDGISTNLANKIHALYGGEEALQLVKNNPYQLIHDLQGVGFKIADRIARVTGVAPNSPYRVEAAIRHVLYEAQNEGHVALSAGEVNKRVLELLGPDCGVTAKDIGQIGRSMIETQEIFREKNHNLVYEIGMHRAEVSLASKIRFLSKMPVHIADKEQIEQMINSAEAYTGIKYAPEQRQAIISALTSAISVITGGPGTGKSTITNAIVSIYKAVNPENNIYLASPTGRAAKRLSEATGFEAKTVHRLLHYSPYYGGFEFNEDNPLPGPGLLIVDEFSMADIELADDLFRALPDDIQVVLVGDIDQLPSVGPGSVLRDVISSGTLPVTRLKFIYRQGKESTIAWLADKIRKGEKVNLAKLAARDDITDFDFIEANDPSDAAFEIEKLAGMAIAAGSNAMEFQVLTPLKTKGAAGADYLNKMIQKSINPPDQGKPELQVGQTTYRLGDKIMVIKNNYDKMVFNGDLGIITNVVNGERMGVTAEIDGYSKFFNLDDLKKTVTLAYAYTIHKSQGGEFPTAIVVCLRSHYIMLQRNLLYTAITRAKQKLIIVGQQSAFDVAVKNTKIQKRNSLLAERLKGAV